jgi:AcrR family transcriptional regulator
LGTKERRQREVHEREDLFLDAALELITADGLLNLQMSRIAEKCEYAVGTLYQHFASKEDLLLALVTREIGSRIELFQRVGDWQAGTRDRMFAVGVADMIFVRRNPVFFRIVQYALCEVAWNAASLPRRKAFLDASQPLRDIIVGIADEASTSGDLDLRGQTAYELSTGLWALSLGFHYLVHAEGVLEDFVSGDPYRLMCRHFHHMLNGLGWKPLFDASDSGAMDALVKRICEEVFNESICNP